MSLPHFVYRCYDDEGDLLYVGCTAKPDERIATHRIESEWFHLVERVRFTVFPSKQYALIKEAQAIRDELPIFNKRVPALRLVTRGHRVTPLNHEPEAVAWALRKAGMTQTQLVEALREAGNPVSKGQLSEIIKGTRNCQQPLLEAIARVLNCPVVALERKREAS